MALSRGTRVNLLIGTGHFMSHFYVLCLPPMFLVWQKVFDVSFAQLGLTVALMSGTTAILQTPVGFLVDRHGARRFLVGGALLMSLSIAAMGLATAFWQILVLAVLSGVGNSVIHPADYAILSGSVDKDRMGRSFALHTFSGNLGFSAGAAGDRAADGRDRLARQPDAGRAARRADRRRDPAAEPHPGRPGCASSRATPARR